MSHDSGPWPETYAETIIERLAELIRRDEERAKIAAELLRRHDENARVNAELNQRLDAVEKRFNDLELLGSEIQRGTDFIQLLAQGMFNTSADGEPMPQPPRPGPGTPRPKAIDDACAIPIGEPATEVQLPRYGMVLVPEPGSDPEQIWSHVQSLDAEGGTRGVRRPGRARGL